MTVSIPIVALLGLGVFLAYRFMGLRVWHALLCLACGFLLAATSAAPQIRGALAQIVVWLMSAGKV
jgi:hypothetical protein